MRGWILVLTAGLTLVPSLVVGQPKWGTETLGWYGIGMTKDPGRS
jgi:hypothetical protein